MPQSLVIGLTGPFAAGKGEAATLLQASGYDYISLSDMVREEAARQGLEPIRDVLIRLGCEMREKGGPGILAKKAAQKIQAPCVVDSIRNPAEVAVLREVPGFILLGVTAPTELRFKRLRGRARPGDPESLPELQEKERIENSKDDSGQQLDATFALADRVITNDSTLEALAAKMHAAIEDLLELSSKTITPTDSEE